MNVFLNSRATMAAATVAIAIGAVSASSVDAAMISFTDQVFTVVTPSMQAGTLGGAQPNAFNEVSDGVTFMFDALANIAGDLRFTGISSEGGNQVNGIRIGGASSSLGQFTFTASHAINLQNFVLSSTLSSFNSGVPLSLRIFDGIGALGTELSSGIVLSGSAGATQVVNLSIAANQTVTFAVIGAFPGGQSSSIGALTSFEFQKTIVDPPPAPIPLPAGGLLLIGALGGLAALRRRGMQRA